MIKKDLVEAISKEVECPTKIVSAVIETALDIVSQSLIAGEEVILRGFGDFKVVKQAQRKGYDFRTKECLNVPEAKKIKFKPYIKL